MYENSEPLNLSDKVYYIRSISHSKRAKAFAHCSILKSEKRRIGRASIFDRYIFINFTVRPRVAEKKVKKKRKTKRFSLETILRKSFCLGTRSVFKRCNLDTMSDASFERADVAMPAKGGGGDTVPVIHNGPKAKW